MNRKQLQKKLILALVFLLPLVSWAATVVPTATLAPVPGPVAMGNIKEYSGCQLHTDPLFDYANSDNGYVLFDVKPTVSGTYSFTATISTGTGKSRYCTLGPIDANGNFIAGVEEKEIPAGIDGTDWTKSKANYVWSYDLTAGTTYTIKIGYRRNGEAYGVNVYKVNVTTAAVGDYAVNYYNEAYTTAGAAYTSFASQPYTTGATVVLPSSTPTAPAGMMFDYWAKADGTRVDAGGAVANMDVYPVWSTAMTVVGANGANVLVPQVKKWNNCVSKGTQLIDSSHDGSYILFDVKATSAGYYTFTSAIATTLDNIQCEVGYVDGADAFIQSKKLAITNSKSWTTTNNYKWLFYLEANTTYNFKMLCYSTGSYCLNAFSVAINPFIADVTAKKATLNGYAVIPDNGVYTTENYYDEDLKVVVTPNSSSATVTYTATCNNVAVDVTNGVIGKSAFANGDVVKVTAKIADGPVTTADYVMTINVNNSRKKQLRGTSTDDGFWSAVNGSTQVQSWTDYIYTLTPAESSTRFSNGTWTPTGGSATYGFYGNNTAVTLAFPTNHKITAVSFIGYGSATLGLASQDATITSTSPTFDAASGVDKPDEVKFAVANHTPGAPLQLTVSNADCKMYVVLSYQEVADVDAPVLAWQNIADNASLTNINGYVSLRFNEAVKLSESAVATLNGQIVKLKLENNVFVNHYFHSLSFASNNTFVLKSNSIEDMSGNKNASDITIHFAIEPKVALTKKTYDFIVGVNGTIADAIVAANANTSTDRYYIFVPNGTHELPGNDGDHMTNITRNNVSIIGQSKDGAIICNTPLSNGISNTATLHLKYVTKTYMEDLTLKNNKGEAGTGVEVALFDRGSKNTFKNVKLYSYQDTYVTGDRGYLEDCDIYGATDYICGGGNLFFDNCLLYNRAASGNKITAPATEVYQTYGYVFSNCKVDGGSYVLGRPWQKEPRAYYLNTTLNIQPAATGWEGMSNCITHFYEYRSFDANGVLYDLSARGNSPSSTNSYSPILTDAQAAELDLYTVVGGTDGWMPSQLTYQTQAPDASFSGSAITWSNDANALCTVIFKDGVYKACTTENSYQVTESGTYTVQSANEMGGLGAAATVIVTVTGIESVSNDKTFNDNAIYDLMGRPLQTVPESGYYIKNGVTYFVK